MKNNLLALAALFLSHHLLAAHLVCFTKTHSTESMKIGDRELYIDYQPREFAANIEVWADGQRTGLFVCQQVTSLPPYLGFECGKETLQLDLLNNQGTMTRTSEDTNNAVQQELICRRQDQLKKL